MVAALATIVAFAGTATAQDQYASDAARLVTGERGMFAVDYLEQHLTLYENAQATERWPELDILDGMDSLPEAMSRVFHGRNRGVQLLRLSEEGKA
jgi:hypothetical protein